MPDTRVMQLWVDALESGEYPQTQGTLHRTKSSEALPAAFCCLGVLCEVAIQDGVPVDREQMEFRTRYSSTENDWDSDTAELPEVVYSWAGFDRGSPTIAGTSFVEMNDSCKYSFADIAQVIREEYLVD